MSHEASDYDSRVKDAIESLAITSKARLGAEEKSFCAQVAQVHATLALAAAVRDSRTCGIHCAALGC